MIIAFNVSISDSEQFVSGTVNLRTPIAVTGPVSAGAFSIRRPFTPRPKFYVSDWTFLEDGKGELIFSWALGCPAGGCRFVIHSTAQITKAVLVVNGIRQEGTP